MTKLLILAHKIPHFSDLLAGDGLPELVDGTLGHDDDVESLSGLVSLRQSGAKHFGPIHI